MEQNINQENQNQGSKKPTPLYSWLIFAITFGLLSRIMTSANPGFDVFLVAAFSLPIWFITSLILSIISTTTKKLKVYKIVNIILVLVSVLEIFYFYQVLNA